MKILTLLQILFQLLNVDNRNISFHQCEMNILNFDISSTPQAKQYKVYTYIHVQTSLNADLVNNISKLFEIK